MSLIVRVKRKVLMTPSISPTKKSGHQTRGRKPTIAL
jgi:hypothetical protein